MVIRYPDRAKGMADPLQRRTPEASTSCSQSGETRRCIDATTAISQHKQLCAAAHFSSATEVKELLRLA